MGNGSIAKIENFKKTSLFLQWKFFQQILSRFAASNQLLYSILIIADCLFLKITFYPNDYTKGAHSYGATIQNGAIYCTFIAISTR